MVDAHQRQAAPQGDALGGVDAHQQRPRQPRPVGHGHRVRVIVAHVGLPHRLLNHGNDGLDVGAGSDLGKDAAVLGVQIHLRGDDVGEDAPPVLDHGGGRFVA